MFDQTQISNQIRILDLSSDQTRSGVTTTIVVIVADSVEKSSVEN